MEEVPVVTDPHHPALLAAGELVDSLSRIVAPEQDLIPVLFGDVVQIDYYAQTPGKKL